MERIKLYHLAWREVPEYAENRYDYEEFYCGAFTSNKDRGAAIDRLQKINRFGKPECDDSYFAQWESTLDEIDWEMLEMEVS